MTTRYVGNCQICEGDQKLHGGRLVHHGYQRPGHGYIVGDCPGVHEPPYEASCDLLVRHIAGLCGYIERQTDYLARLQGGEIAELYLEEREGHGRDRRTVQVRVVAGTPDANKYDISYSATRWERALRHAVSETESNLRAAKADIVRCKKRVVAWVEKPIRTVEEEQQKADGLRAERKAAKQAVRDARAAKKAATAAKHEALKAKRAAIRADFDAQFNALAASTAPDRKAAAIRLLQQTRKTKFAWLALWDLRCETALRDLGLATLDGVNGLGRPCVRWSDEVVAAMEWRRP
jgi:hypothetical protein